MFTTSSRSSPITSNLIPLTRNLTSFELTLSSLVRKGESCNLRDLYFFLSFLVGSGLLVSTVPSLLFLFFRGLELIALRAGSGRLPSSLPKSLVFCE